jgi:hypothetical protein
MLVGYPIKWTADFGDPGVYLSESSVGWALVASPVPTIEHSITGAPCLPVRVPNV